MSEIRKPDDVKVVNKPWGWEKWLAHTDRYAGKILFVKKGHRYSMQYHVKKHETQYIMDGKISMEIGPDGDHVETRVLGPGTVIEVTPGTWHRITAVEDTHIFEVSTPELDDVVRISDDYGREGTSKP